MFLQIYLVQLEKQRYSDIAPDNFAICFKETEDSTQLVSTLGDELKLFMDELYCTIRPGQGGYLKQRFEKQRLKAVEDIVPSLSLLLITMSLDKKEAFKGITREYGSFAIHYHLAEEG